LKGGTVSTDDKTLKFVLIWIAVMLTILAVDKILHIPVAIAQEGGTYTQSGPTEVVIKEPVKIEIARWSAYPSQALKVKIDDPWPAKIEIEDEVKITGELKLRD
jgi:hypothetical protein